MFESLSGLKINIEKIKAIFIGRYKNGKETRFSLDWANNKTETLGVTGNTTDNYNSNFKLHILEFKNLLQSWKGRELSIKGKIIIINTLVIPQ